MAREIPYLMLECQECGHPWKPRNTLGKSRECSKCGSKKIEEFDPEEAVEEVPPEETEVKQNKMKSRVQPPRLDKFTDDPDVKAKRKQLLLAKLDNQINEEHRQPSDETVLKLLLGWVKTISRSLYKRGVLEEDLFTWYDCVCPWCKSVTMEFEEGENGYQRWRCNECGRSVPE